MAGLEESNKTRQIDVLYVDGGGVQGEMCHHMCRQVIEQIHTDEVHAMRKCRPKIWISLSLSVSVCNTHMMVMVLPTAESSKSLMTVGTIRARTVESA